MKSIIQRRKEAQQRLDLRARRSDKEQLALIAKRPGSSLREAGRIQARVKTMQTDNLNKHGEVAVKSKRSKKAA